MSKVHQRRVRAEQIRTLFRYAPLSLFGSASLCLATVAVLYPDVSVRELWLWAGAVLLLTLGRTLHYLWARGYLGDDARMPALGRHTVWFAGALGVLWAWLPIYYIQPNELLTLTSVSLFLVGMLAGGVVTQSVYLPAVFVFALPIMGASFFAILINGGDYSYLAWIGLTYSIIAILFVFSIHRMFRETIDTRFANVDLVDRLRAEKQQAEQANHAKSQFLAAASHDLRQPLHAVSLYAEILRDDPGNVEVVERLGGALRSMEVLYDRILEISKLDAGVIEPELTSVCVPDLLDAVESRYRPVAEDRRLALRVDHQDLWVRSDRVLLERILDNLMSNALRYTSRGGVTLRAYSEQETVVIEVDDSGIGIAETEQAKVFGEFYQVDNPERDREKGLGLGLSIVSRLAELLGHEVRLDSQPGIGSCFGLKLQRVPAVAESPIAANPLHDLSGVRILVIEDELEVQTATAAMLNQWGCDVAVVEGGDSLESLDAAPELIIADFRLRDGETGVEAVAAVNERFGTRVPALIVTGDTAPERIRDVARSDFPLLHKPVNPGELRVALNALLMAG